MFLPLKILVKVIDMIYDHTLHMCLRLKIKLSTGYAINIVQEIVLNQLGEG